MYPIKELLQQKINSKTKPLGALGHLETLALKIGTIQNTLTPKLTAPHMLVFAADHGLAQEGVSAYPTDVTYQMVNNFLNGGAAINVFCKQNNINLKVIDAGVNGDFSPHPQLYIQKAAKGSQNMLNTQALTSEQLKLSLEFGANTIRQINISGCNVVGFGEMGIGNTSSASLIFSALMDRPIEEFVGRGTGMSDEQLKHKITVLKKVEEFHKDQNKTPMNILKTFGGLEIAQMVGAMMEAFNNNMILLIDGFIATAAFLILYKVDQNIKNNALFCHQSDEQAHKIILDYLDEKPILNLNLRVGEGTGCALAYPVIKSAVGFLNEMSSFDEALVSNKN